MKIYFTASISGIDRFEKNYKAIVDELKDKGHEVLEETLGMTQKYVYEEISQADKHKFYLKLVRWIKACDVVVVEVSNPSLSLGHEIGLALEKNKPVVVLFCEGNAPHLISVADNSKLIIEKYDTDNLSEVLKYCLDLAVEKTSTRFTMLIPNQLWVYLDEVKSKTGTSWSQIIRDLIRKDMTKKKHKN